MKKCVILCLFLLILITTPVYSQITGQLKFYTNYGDEVFNMGFIPIQDRAELQARAIITHVPQVFGAVGIEYNGAILYHDASNYDTESYSQYMRIYWEKSWGNRYGKLFTKLAWKWQTYYETLFESGQFVEGTIGLEVPGNPYFRFAREYSTYKFNEARLGVEHFFPLYQQNFRLYLGASVNYISFDDSVDETVSVNVNTDGDQVIVIDRLFNDAYSNWHSYRLAVGFSWAISRSIELIPLIELVGGINDEARTQMETVGDTDLLWIPTISFYYKW